ncbi:PhzF family phenazine biosynthesis protein [Echinicola sp. CAU 1574]|uniref:PhzF family phenazine biosynthesis protein n=1 Tax=Echinicola arenosa TaxID=2774144 RepID=A0ABR9AP19_9BACT|nr:PhzF family phenazine biosynthesis protein [Echinicola arenosa]MBD8490531.1 PhzF family phenazine biosynthesis protein [Echinicola arenosa]
MEVYYQIISVFTSKEFNYKGNPAAVLLLENHLSRAAMQEMARKLNQPASTFLVKRTGGHGYDIRWFAPDAEIGLCGHGTAAATAFLGIKEQSNGPFTFNYRDGKLTGKVNPDQTVTIGANAILIQGELEEIPLPIKEGLNVPILGMFKTSNKYLILTDSEESVKNMQPDFNRLQDSDIFGYAVTAKGDNVDFVSRTIVPHTLGKEDYATGSSHAMLVPFWAEKLNKQHMKAVQLSSRGGAFLCGLKHGVVELTGEFLIEEKQKISVPMGI